MGVSSILFYLGGASLANNLAFQLESQGVDPRNKFQQFTKQTEKHHSLKSKISIKEVVSKFRYFQHACQSGPKSHHSWYIHLPAQALFAVDLHFTFSRNGGRRGSLETLYPNTCATGVWLSKEVDEGVSKDVVWIFPRCKERSTVFQLDLHISKVT